MAVVVALVMGTRLVQLLFHYTTLVDFSHCLWDGESEILPNVHRSPNVLYIGLLPLLLKTGKGNTSTSKKQAKGEKKICQGVLESGKWKL
jgi:hypothetical protein